jgi:hypothetical protein
VDLGCKGGGHRAGIIIERPCWLNVPRLRQRTLIGGALLPVEVSVLFSGDRLTAAMAESTSAGIDRSWLRKKTP